ncbi:cobalamin/Fe3+-siderophore ABC transporter ATP-binding protein [Actinomadura sp. NBRC 104425]|uniref:ABC transporter ATP-binding protein n=1 Tax=Actinomadura sp. NBRC 104425 TaxID=3032204 RepID=UPI0024A42891|nr:ABC transporter ATP-binding protein [Actinomadura sp. NBRC 104425]GLZ10947.1 cobalamin/Fe3+-siderophore ABC transporter ATP-binding protein [Actinomadura sp. NBRC 104425]
MTTEHVPPSSGPGPAAGDADAADADARPPVRLEARGLRVGYGDRLVIEDLDLELPGGAFTVIIGPNACGKSTLLRTLARLLAPRGGAALIDGADVHAMPTRELARRLGVLPQSPVTPEGLTVADLVARGRQPHQRWFRQWSAADTAAVERALRLTGLSDLRDRPVEALSGGQRQRVWIALTLAQDTDALLLDEPTTYLDLAHQIEVLDLLRRLNRGGTGRTVVAVLHDLNQACRYADHLVVMKDGRVVAQGPPGEVMNADRLEEVFGLGGVVIPCPLTGAPLVVPGAPG